MRKAIIVGIVTGKEDQYYLEELINLAKADDIEVVEIVKQNLKTPNGKYYIGKGKVDELKDYIKYLNPDLIIFDEELSPSQVKNLEEALEVQIIDRTLLILDIFAMRARTRISKLQVELAKAKYMLPRLIGLNKGLSRQTSSGNLNSKGQGETQLELDRRVLLNNIYKIKDELKEKEIERQTEKSKRLKNNIKLVSLCGYTNAGKSSILNKLIELSNADTSKQVFEKDMLFATLDTETRKIKFKNMPEFLLSDTIGFISKLPHHLIEAFKATLEQLEDADLLLHVVDASNPNYLEQIETTNQVLESLNLTNKPVIYVMNKADLCLNKPNYLLNDYVVISAKTNQGIDNLLAHINEILFKEHQRSHLLIPYDRGDLYAKLKQKAMILEENSLDDGIHIFCELPVTLNDQFKDYIK